MSTSADISQWFDNRRGFRNPRADMAIGNIKWRKPCRALVVDLAIEAD